MSKMTFRRVLLPAVAVALLMGGLPAFIASAQPPPPPDAPLVPPLADDDDPNLSTAVEGATDSCVDVAVARKLSQWTCVGPQLVTPGGVELLTVAPRPPDPSRSAPGKVQPRDLPDPDDYDTWCENASVCSRPSLDNPNYIHETKANAAYGDQDGYIGSFDHIVRTNLNGRSARWTVTYIHDDGPLLTMSRATVWCRKENFGINRGCGFHDVGAFTISSTNRRYSSGLIQGNHLSDSDEYYGTSYGQYAPSGYDLQLSVPNLETERFNCYGTSNDRCYFPS